MILHIDAVLHIQCLNRFGVVALCFIFHKIHSSQH